MGTTGIRRYERQNLGYCTDRTSPSMEYRACIYYLIQAMRRVSKVALLEGDAYNTIR